MITSYSGKKDVQETWHSSSSNQPQYFLTDNITSLRQLKNINSVLKGSIKRALSTLRSNAVSESMLLCKLTHIRTFLFEHNISLSLLVSRQGWGAYFHGIGEVLNRNLFRTIWKNVTFTQSKIFNLAKGNHFHGFRAESEVRTLNCL